MVFSILKCISIICSLLIVVTNNPRAWLPCDDQTQHTQHILTFLVGILFWTNLTTGPSGCKTDLTCFIVPLWMNPWSVLWGCWCFYFYFCGCVLSCIPGSIMGPPRSTRLLSLVTGVGGIGVKVTTARISSSSIRFGSSSRTLLG